MRMEEWKRGAYGKCKEWKRIRLVFCDHVPLGGRGYRINYGHCLQSQTKSRARGNQIVGACQGCGRGENDVMGEIQLEGISHVEETSGVWVDGQYVGYLK